LKKNKNLYYIYCIVGVIENYITKQEFN